MAKIQHKCGTKHLGILLIAVVVPLLISLCPLTALWFVADGVSLENSLSVQERISIQRMYKHLIEKAL